MQTLNFDIQQVESLAAGLWTVGHIFNDADFTYIDSAVKAIGLDQYMSGIDNRYELIWQNDSVLEELTNAFRNIEDQVCAITNLDVKFNQVRVWRDTPGFMIPFHEDDQQATVHIQTYIHGEVGTTWYTPTGRTTVPFVPNSGYITQCSERYPHGTLMPTTIDRFSLYATFNQKALAFNQ
jgi:hypothetical protein